MQTISTGLVTEWVVSNRMWTPQSIDIECPHCGRLVNFAFTEWPRNNPNLSASSSRCSGCRQDVMFLMLEPRGHGATTQECAELAIHPSPQMRRSPIAAVDAIPPSIARAYISAIKVYNAGEWTATAVLCRRVLEGLTQNQLPEELRKRPLAQQLQELPNHVDHARPITTLTHAIRKGGNLGAHFDEEKEADQETVTMMIELLEYLMEYVYTLPSRIDDLHKMVAAEDKSDSQQTV